MILAASSSADRIKRLMEELGIERAHIAACVSGDWGQFVLENEDRVQSLALVAPYLNKGTPDGLDLLQFQTFIVSGDQGSPASQARSLVEKFTNCDLLELKDYSSPIWADIVADWTSEVASALNAFFDRADPEGSLSSLEPVQREGEIDGIAFRIEGAGPPLILLPLSLAPSQWEPLVPLISDRFCTISLRGPYLGAVELLEARERSGYGRLVRQVLEHAKLAAGESVLEVGCGTGALVRRLAETSGKQLTITATDLNRYLLSEAEFLAGKEGVGNLIRFEEADATALPYSDNQFDVVICCTVLEEGDANAMVSEISRVTKPGGRAVVMTRAVDVDWYFSLRVPEELSAKLNSLGPKAGAGVGEDGCADVSLYGRLSSAGFAPRIMGPIFAIYKEDDRINTVVDRLGAMLPAEDVPLYRDAVRRATEDRSLFVGEPFHSFVGTKMA